MPRLQPTAEIIENILSRIPEGFIRYDILCQRVRMDRNTNASLVGGKVARDGEWWYDASRLTQEQLHEHRKWGRPFFPDLKAYMWYQSPYFRVKAGNFKERKDAEET